MIFKTPISGYTIMEIPERNVLLKAFERFEKNKLGHQEQDALFIALNGYIDYLLCYCQQE